MSSRKETFVPISNSKLLDQNSEKNFNQEFWYYTSTDILDKILDEKMIWVRSISVMNDKREAETHNKDAKNTFALCFCNTATEKIPMWYLYAGIGGAGARLGLTKSNFRKFIDSIQKVFPITNGKVDMDHPLYPGQDIMIETGWIYYVNESRIFYRNKFFEVDDIAEFCNDNFFVKDYPWNYEKEYRILIKNHSQHQCDALAVCIPDEVYKKLKIGTGPEMSRSQDLLNMNGFRKYASIQIQPSSLMIKMDLLERNKTSIFQQLPTWVEKMNDEDIASLVEALKQSTKFAKEITAQES